MFSNLFIISTFLLYLNVQEIGSARSYGASGSNINFIKSNFYQKHTMFCEIYENSYSERLFKIFWLIIKKIIKKNCWNILKEKKIVIIE